jgi:hypothetical protein
MDGFTSYHLKLIAALTMLVDHIGVFFFPEQPLFRIIGRFSFPLFVWLLVQGERYTHNIWRYGWRLLALGILSQPIYQLAFDTERFNILFQLLIGLACLRLVRNYPRFSLPIWSVGALSAELLNVSYGSYGIILALLTHYFRPTLLWWLAWVGFHLLWAWGGGTFQLPAIVVPLFFVYANDRRGPKARWFYGFYPGHLAVLIFIRWALNS